VRVIEIVFNIETVSSGSFEAMGIRIVRGRAFSERDTSHAPGVVIVSESAARRIWPGRDPIGQRLRDMSYRAKDPAGATSWQTVVGVAEDVRYRGLTDVRLDLYVPSTQSNERIQYLMVRTTAADAVVTRAVRDAARGIDQRFTIGDAESMSQIVTAESAPWRFILRVFVGFAVSAALLAAVGVATLISLAVATRRRELAVRAALGANAGQLRSAVLQEGLWLSAIGVVIGLLAAWALSRTIESVLINVSPHDALSLVAAAVVTVSVGVAACWWAARRASDVDPGLILRPE
jgi:hypothetical protein